MAKQYTCKVWLAGLLLLIFVVSTVSPQIASAATTTAYTPQTQQEMIAYLMGVLAQLQAQLKVKEQQNDTSDTKVSSTSSRNQPNPYYVSLVAVTPERITREQAVLRGVVDGGGAKIIDAWFEYGTGSDLKMRSKVYSSNDDLSSGRRNDVDAGKLTMIWVDNIEDDVSFDLAMRITDLNPGTKYSYRLVVEDDKGYRHHSQILSFTTISKASNQVDESIPSVDTEYVKNIESRSAEIGGFIDMNEAGIGKAILIYGSNRALVRDVVDYDEYVDVPLAVNGFRNKLIVNNFTARNTIWYRIDDIKTAVTYYFRACVEYDDKDKGNTIRCGKVESFTTPT